MNPLDKNKWRTHTFDNERFFSPYTEGGMESGSDGWARITAKGYREYLPTIDPERCALIVVDIDGAPDSFGESGWAQSIAKYNKEQADIWGDRMDHVLLPNIAKLLKLFRENKMMVVYTSNRELATPDRYPAAIAPQEGDRGIVKYSSGAFASSALDNLLRENGIATLFFAGHDTACCVSHTMAGAYDRSYQTILVSDACFASVPELHDAAVKIWAYKGYVRTTDQVVQDYPWKKWIDPGLKSVVQEKVKR